MDESKKAETFGGLENEARFSTGSLAQELYAAVEELFCCKFKIFDGGFKMSFPNGQTFSVTVRESD